MYTISLCHRQHPVAVECSCPAAIDVLISTPFTIGWDHELQQKTTGDIPATAESIQWAIRVCNIVQLETVPATVYYGMGGWVRVL